MARFNQQMRTWPRSSEGSEGSTNYHAKDAKMFPGLCGCKATATTTREVGKRPGEKAERYLDVVLVLGFLERLSMQMLQDLSYKAYQIKINLLTPKSSKEN